MITVGGNPNTQYDAVQHERSHWDSVFLERLSKGELKYKHHWWADLYERIFRTITAYHKFEKCQRVVECGCGTGYMTMRLAHLVSEVTLLDIAPSALHFAKFYQSLLEVPAANYVTGSCFEIPFEENSFDFAWNFGVLEHYDFETSKRMISEMLRVTRVGGSLVVGVPNFASYPLIKAQIWSTPVLSPLGIRLKIRQLSTEKNYTPRDLAMLLDTLDATGARRVSNLTLTYTGTAVPIGAPKWLFNRRKWLDRFFATRSFLVFALCKKAKSI